jgi:hypothetical protein
MNIKGILLGVVVFVLTAGYAWGATEVSCTAGFTVVPDNEAAQIVGGAGWACNTRLYYFFYSTIR